MNKSLPKIAVLTPFEGATSVARGGKRNLAIRVREEIKTELKELAKSSGMTLEEYVSAVLCNAVNERERYQITVERIKTS